MSDVNLALVLLSLSIALRALDYLVHIRRIDTTSIRLEGDEATKLRQIRKVFSNCGTKQVDDFLAPLLFVAIWGEIVAAFLLINILGPIGGTIAAVFFVTGRMRALQELAHYGMHGTLCPQRKIGDFWVTLFFQAPLFKCTASERRLTHIVEHHPNANNQEKDPNIQDLKDFGLEPGISETQFWKGIFFPLTVMGIYKRILGILSLSSAARRNIATLGFLFLTIFFSALSLLKLSLALSVFVFIFCAVVTYPQAAWVSHLVEHRWFVPKIQGSWFDMEIDSGHRLALTPFQLVIARIFLLPFGDHLHLAHSLFPKARFNYLGEIDRLLVTEIPSYSTNTSTIFAFAPNNAILQLRSRLVETKL